MRRFPLLASVAALALAGCSSGINYQDSLTGLPAQPTPAIFRTLHDGIGPIGRYASMTVVSPEWALTNDHADGIASGLRYEAPQADLALVHIEGGDPLPLGTAHVGDKVTLFGTGSLGERRVAHGIVQNDKAFVCWGKPAVGDADNVCKTNGLGIEWALVISSDAGGGFSGGPVINEAGELVGVQEQNFFPSGGFTSTAVSEGQLVADVVPVPRDGERVTVAYAISPALREFFPDGDASRPVLASAKPAEPASWFARWGWVVLLVVI
jgi:hypothetical protein